MGAGWGRWGYRRGEFSLMPTGGQRIELCCALRAVSVFQAVSRSASQHICSLLCDMPASTD